MALSIYSRYASLPIYELAGAVTLSQRELPPATTEEAGSLLHVITGQETLDALARMYYGNEELWWRIADANPGRFALDWAPGDTIVIPPIQSATRVGGA